MSAKSFQDRLFEAASDALTYPLPGPTLKTQAQITAGAEWLAEQIQSCPVRKQRAELAKEVARLAGIFSPEPYDGACGMCVECKEWCEVGASCCGRGVIFEGGFVADIGEDGE